jgi:hypothetical protein
MERVTSRKTHPRPNGKQLLAANWRRLALANPETFEDEDDYETVNRELFSTWYTRCYDFWSYGQIRD